MKFDEYIQENNAQIFDDIDSLWREINVKYNNFVIKSKTTPSLVEKYNFVLRGAFSLLGSYQHFSISKTQINEMYICDESLNGMLVQVDSSSVNDVKSIFSYATYGKTKIKTDYGNPNEVKEYVKYNFGMYLTLGIDENNEVNGQIVLNFAEEINENIVPNEKVFNILKDKPFLIGFIGIKNRYIPIVADDESVLENLNIKTYTLSLSGSLKETLVTRIDIRTFGNKPISLDVPIIFFKNKVFYAFRNAPKELLEIISSPTIKIGSYKFENNTHIGVIIIRNITEYVKNNTLKDYTPLASCITYDMVNAYKDDIKILVNSAPLTQDDLSKAGLSNDILNIYLRLSSILLSNRYAINKDILTATYSILKNSINAFINETDQIIVKQDVEKILAVISFYYESITEAAEKGEMVVVQIDKIREEIERLITNRVKINNVRFKEKLKSMYKISDQDAQNIIENMKNRGFIDEIEEDDALILSEDVKRQILNM